ncbi:protein FAM166A-like [Microcaecilia unicolor]|uniref:Protein FAM166A-like n=1 Tax=Microcaecilia unicolor TaxID=1415580 RepID=A0A6P7Y558_9AMPH|nr:protein FAM166A-like [Microcaecilia unicolor]
MKVKNECHSENGKQTLMKKTEMIASTGKLDVKIYAGFCPQLRYQTGNTYGKTTNRLLTDPSVVKSPHSVLAPISTLPLHSSMGNNGITSSTNQSFPLKTDQRHVETYISGYTGHVPNLKFQSGRTYSTLANSAREKFLANKADREERKKEPMVIMYADGTSQSMKPDQLGPLVSVTQYPDLSKYHRIGRDVAPNLIQRNAISGYSGFVPRFSWDIGNSFLPAVKKCLDEFDRRQFQLTHPVKNVENIAKPSYWPTNKIYTAAGQIPFYKGFVPGLRDECGASFTKCCQKAYKRNPF